MRILVIGAGAIGGWLAGVLSRGGAEVSVLARGDTLAALRSDGLTLLNGDRRETLRLPESVFRIDELGVPIPGGHAIGLQQTYFPG